VCGQGHDDARELDLACGSQRIEIDGGAIRSRLPATVYQYCSISGIQQDRGQYMYSGHAAQRPACQYNRSIMVVMTVNFGAAEQESGRIQARRLNPEWWQTHPLGQQLVVRITLPEPAQLPEAQPDAKAGHGQGDHRADQAGPAYRHDRIRFGH
jgi:hypothetical protein